jgi:translation initiation factor IF-1
MDAPIGLAAVHRGGDLARVRVCLRFPTLATGRGLCQGPAASVFQGKIAIIMSKGDLLEMEGVIQDALGGGQYTIKVDQGGAMVRAQLSGRMRRHHIRVLPGDKVRVAVSPYDLSHGLIVYRGRS